MSNDVAPVEWVITNSTVVGAARLVLTAIAGDANEHGEASVTVDDVARRARIHRDTAKRLIKRLDDAGHLTRIVQAGGDDTTRDDRRPNLFVVHTDQEMIDYLCASRAGRSMPRRNGNRGARPNKKPKATTTSSSDAAYVFIDRSRGEVKIGKSHQPEARLRQVMAASGRALEMIATFPGGGATEAELHKRFAAHRTHGEWFRIEGPLAKWINDLDAYNVDPFEGMDLAGAR